ncbi:RNA-binding domain superfamily [Abeliophyllum distichum]|uniref:RNA-binding domain superfamily n=1 Tax=Abeliophyllum distichum TaxID=126358 RepID=A0ABD1SG77_9LAMI
MSILRFRHFGDEAPRYGAKNNFFTLEVHHGGKLFDKSNNVVYEHGYVMFVDFVLPQHFTRGMLNKFCDAYGSRGEMTFYYKKWGLSLGKGLVRLKSEADVREMLRDRNGQRVVQIYVVGPQASLSLAMEAFEEHDDGVNNEGIGLGSDNNGGCYVPTM